MEQKTRKAREGSEICGDGDRERGEEGEGNEEIERMIKGL